MVDSGGGAAMQPLRLSRYRSISSLVLPILAHPGFGLWPPLLTANLTFVNVTTLNARDTSFVFFGETIQLAGSQHSVDLGW